MLNRPFLWMATLYVAMIITLAVGALLTEDTIGPALRDRGRPHLASRIGIYPVLWLNAFTLGRVGSEASLVGVILIFAAAAIGNAVVARAAWTP